MNIFNSFRGVVEAQLQSMASAGELPDGLDTSRVTVEPPRDPSHGDMATNAAMVLAKPAGIKPRDLAEKIAEGLRANDNVADIDIAGPGFINFRLKTNAWQNCLKELLVQGVTYGDCDLGKGKPVNVEYVSANPTGPLTAGHARGAVFGDALANLLEKAGFDVTREYYVNDAGAQVDTLARSTFLRYREALGLGAADIPAGFYPGDYLKEVGEALARRDGDKWADTPEEEHLTVMREFAVEFLLKEIREDLAMLGISQDIFSSEAQIVAEGAVDEAFKTLEDKGLIYTGVLEPPKGKTPEDWEPRPQTLFKATDFGDDVDRPMKKSDGSWTYFANDIAYHWNKYRRGYTKMIDIFGADHGGYVKRMKAAVKALTGGEGELEIKLCQLVHMYDNGEPVRMSKRAGTFVTLNDVIKSVGRDVVRFIMLTRRNDQSLDFDYAKVTEQSKDNPVFYVQYCHARCSSVLRHAANDYPQFDLSGPELSKAPLHRLDDVDELQLIRMMAAWPRMVEAAAEAEEPHRVAFYLYDLAALFHQHWNRGRDDATLRFMIEDDPEVTHARLAMVQAVRTVIASGLHVMGVEPLEEMHS